MSPLPEIREMSSFGRWEPVSHFLRNASFYLTLRNRSIVQAGLIFPALLLQPPEGLDYKCGFQSQAKAILLGGYASPHLWARPQEAEAAGSPRLWDQPGLYSEYWASEAYRVKPCLKKKKIISGFS